jgi:signal transduction histidine kinase
MNEGTTSIVKVEFPISEIVSDAAGSFAAPLRAMGKQLATDVTPLLSYVGDSAAVERVVTILLDNAMKYSSDGSTVRLTLRGSRSAITLTVENEVDAPVEKRDIAHIFDRFYRSDASRNSETGGHGIGLSIASMIVDAHGGRIYASSENKHSFKITAVFPQ